MCLSFRNLTPNDKNHPKKSSVLSVLFGYSVIRVRIYNGTSIIVYSNLLTSPSVKWQLRNNLPSQLTMAKSAKRVDLFKISLVVSYLSRQFFIYLGPPNVYGNSVVSLFQCAQPDMRRVLSINNVTRQLPYKNLLHSRRISVYVVGTYFTT